MNPDGDHILHHLQQVAAERMRQAADPDLASRLGAVKAFQHARFAQTYQDLMQQPRYARAARFFLEELYGPGDFSQRDAQFARIVPALVRLFPREIVGTVRQLAELHALSETLDMAMAAALSPPQGGPVATPAAAAPSPAEYAKAWRAVGRPADREQQIALMLAVGDALDRYTRKPLLRHSLRLMRGPAQAAGLAALQSFLESGFDTFRAMQGAAEFLGIVASRERALVAQLFAANDVALATNLPA